MIPREFVEYLMDSIAPLGPVSPRRMFGCTALFHTGRMFALVTDDDSVFVKVDDQTRAQFVEAGLVPLTYETSRGGQPKTVALSFYTVPDGAVADPDALLHWARLGQQAAARVPAKNARRRTMTRRG
ncbi:MAG: TfoX/Sxy family protein [Rhizomicrobium sp.]